MSSAIKRRHTRRKWKLLLQVARALLASQRSDISEYGYESTTRTSESYDLKWFKFNTDNSSVTHSSNSSGIDSTSSCSSSPQLHTDLDADLEPRRDNNNSYGANFSICSEHESYGDSNSNRDPQLHSDLESSDYGTNNSICNEHECYDDNGSQ